MAGDPLIGQVLHDTHRLIRVLGRGGMGTVYEARHVRLHRQRFAVKILRQPLVEDPAAYARFRREAEITTAIGHRNIVYVTDFYQTQDGLPCIVMEYLEGEDLMQHLRGKGRLSSAEVCSIISPLGSALQVAHDMGVVHRDLKPSNIFLVTQRDEAPFIKILDFGISKMHDVTALTQDQAIMGTPHYMSPEQGEGKVSEVDHRTDIFALAIIGYQLLTGELPFNAPSLPGVIRAICDKPHAPVRSRVPSLPLAVEQVLSQALAKRKEDRHGRIEEFVTHLCHALESPSDEHWDEPGETYPNAPLPVPVPPEEEPAVPNEGPKSMTPEGKGDPCVEAGQIVEARAEDPGMETGIACLEELQLQAINSSSMIGSTPLQPEKLAIDPTVQPLRPLSAVATSGAMLSPEPDLRSLGHLPGVQEKQVEGPAPWITRRLLPAGILILAAAAGVMMLSSSPPSGGSDLEASRKPRLSSSEGNLGAPVAIQPGDIPAPGRTEEVAAGEPGSSEPEQPTVLTSPEAAFHPESQIRIVLKIFPGTGQARLDGELVHQRVLHLDKDETQHRLTVSAPGFQTEDLVFRSTRDEVFRVRLVPTHGPASR